MTLLTSFEFIYTIELSHVLFERADKLFKRFPHVRVLEGDSSRLLGTIIKSLRGNILFWLDAHFDGELTARGEKITPIEEELAVIAQYKNGLNIILIDDAHHFRGINDYPTLKQLEETAERLFPTHLFRVEHNIIRILPK
jgi:hypothetical protein